MIRLSTVFWLVLVSATAFAMFAVKYQVQALADELAQTARRAAGAEHQIRALDAEWAYLNRPDALAQMNQRYMSLVPIATKQLRTSLTDIPLRPPPPPPPPPPVETVAAPAGAAVVAEAASEPLPSHPPQNRPPESRSAENAPPLVTIALQTPSAAPRPVKAVAPKNAARPRPAHRARSLDDLIAQITETR